jgi:SAM-dependent methyltransferase
MSAQPDFDALKQRQQAAWASGDYAVIGTTLQLVGEQLAEACNLRWGDRVLDVAAGNGNATLAAARRGARVISTDYVAELLEAGARRADAEGLAVDFQHADAEALPFADGSFDAVLSTFGVMFAPDQERAAAELLRVTRPGGVVATANWTPTGFIGQMFKVLARHVPPPPGVQSPMRWGNELQLQALFGVDAADLVVTHRRDFVFRYASPAHFVEVFRTWYGPVHKAFASLDAGRAAALEQDLLALLEELNEDGDRSLVIPGEYVEVLVGELDIDSQFPAAFGESDRLLVEFCAGLVGKQLEKLRT